MELKLSSLNEKDIPALLDLAREIGWGYNAENWRQFFRLGLVYGHRTRDGHPISSAVMIKYGDSLRWLTSFIVSPRFQRRGLARQLWTELRKTIHPEQIPVGLVSTEEGMPFYESIGFKQISCVHKYVRADGFGLGSPGDSHRPMRSVLMEDLETLVALDQAGRGVQRKAMLLEKLRSAMTALLTCDQGNPIGFAVAAMEGNILCVGPVVAPDEKSAAHLIFETTKSHKGPLRIDVMPEKHILHKSLQDQGFQKERVPPVLCYGGLELPRTSTHYMALAAQALG